MNSCRKPFVFKSWASLTFTLTVLFSLFFFRTLSGEILELSPIELEWRIRKFYPIGFLKDERFSSIKMLAKKRNTKEALQEAEVLYRHNPTDLKTAYCYQAVKSYDFVTSDWKEISNPPSPLLVFFSWIELTNKNYESALILSKKCRDLYLNEALRQQSNIGLPPAGESRRYNWALNDVAVSLYIMGECLMKTGKHQEAYDVFKKIGVDFPSSFCYDYARRRFWKPAEAAQKKMETLLAQHGVRDTKIEQAGYTLSSGPIPDIQESPPPPIEIKEPPIASLPPVRPELLEPEVLAHEPPPVEEVSISQQKDEMSEETNSITSPPDEQMVQDEIEGPIQKEGVLFTEEPITSKDIENQQLAMKAPDAEDNFDRAPMEQLIIEEVEPVAKSHFETPPPAFEPDKSDITAQEEEIPPAETADETDFSSQTPAEETPYPSVEQPPDEEKAEVPFQENNIQEDDRPAPSPLQQKDSLSEEDQEKETPPKGPRIYNPKDKKNLKEVLVFVKKGLTIKWTDQKNDKGLYEAIEKREGMPPKVLEFKDIEEFYNYAEDLGFTR